MKLMIESLLQEAMAALVAKHLLPDVQLTSAKLERTKDATHGDYASNLAMVLAKPSQLPPRQVAQLLIDVMPAHPTIERIEIAGPGFINFFVKADARHQVIACILESKGQYGCSQTGQGKKVLLEFVSANPTGPLHVGHGRGAAFGASLANLLQTVGYEVTREYYVNDAGRQMNILAVSVWLRYLELWQEPVVFPNNAYRGEYVFAIAAQLQHSHGREFVHSWYVISVDLPADEPQGGDKEVYIDAMIAAAKSCLGETGFQMFHQAALHAVLDDIKQDLQAFGVQFDNWFSEQKLLTDGSIANSIDALTAAKLTYEHNGALWFKATTFGDEKDRVLIRSNQQTTYFASDVAYHWAKYNRGYDIVIDIFGADHHGYVPRITAAVKALGQNEHALQILLVQFAILYREGLRVQMSTRSGSFVTLRELREEVGQDAARFFYVMRKPEQHMDFDLDLAKSQSSDNPVYYIQYAHARICSVFRQLAERGHAFDVQAGLSQVALLEAPHEEALLLLLVRYPEIVAQAANDREPHQVAYYLRELANGLHSYYNAVVLLCEQEPLRLARLCLLAAVRQVLANGLQLLGVSAPETM